MLPFRRPALSLTDPAVATIGNPTGVQLKIPCGKPQGIFDRKECGHFLIRWITPPQAAGNALAVRFNFAQIDPVHRLW
jgi:hypothetical protein